LEIFTERFGFAQAWPKTSMVSHGNPVNFACDGSQSRQPRTKVATGFTRWRGFKDDPSDSIILLKIRFDELPVPAQYG
jgi:hypothetical protein